MWELRRILCPIDFSEFSVTAYRHALSLAQHYHALLFVQHVVELWRYPSANFAPAVPFEEFCRVLREKGKEELEDFLKNNAHGATEMVRVVAQGVASDSILDLAETQEADLIVMGTHGRRGFDRLIVGSVTERVMRKASCPVMVVHSLPPDSITRARRLDSSHFRRLLFCTDLSENSQRALDYATSLAADNNGEVTILHVLDDFVNSAPEGASAKAAERLNQLISREGRKTVRTKIKVCNGKPYEQIIRVALESQTDLLIMALPRRNVLRLAVFSSTTHCVVRLGPCPVLVVPLNH